jgi:hypothetical protein
MRRGVLAGSVGRFEEEPAFFTVEAHFIANEEVLTVLSAAEMRESDDGTDHAA